MVRRVRAIGLAEDVILVAQDDVDRPCIAGLRAYYAVVGEQLAEGGGLSSVELLTEYFTCKLVLYEKSVLGTSLVGS